MGKKDKKKGCRTRDDDKGQKKELHQGRKSRQKGHKGRNWKADKDDPIRKAVEAGTCASSVILQLCLRFV